MVNSFPYAFIQGYCQLERRYLVLLDLEGLLLLIKNTSKYVPSYKTKQKNNAYLYASIYTFIYLCFY